MSPNYIWELFLSPSLKTFQLFDFRRESHDENRYFFLEFQNPFIRRKSGAIIKLPSENFEIGKFRKFRKFSLDFV